MDKDCEGNSDVTGVNSANVEYFFNAELLSDDGVGVNGDKVEDDEELFAGERDINFFAVKKP